MNLKHALTTGAVAVASTGALLATSTTAAHAADADTAYTSGTASGTSQYTYRLSDSGSELRNQTVRFTINSSKGKGRVWKVTVLKDGEAVTSATETTDRHGNFVYKTTIRADDDAEIKVRAVAGYGEHAKSTLSLD
ncbi:hypothetical protein [Nocardioides mangrovi]|uniref:Uncharacterized protein n=1 Tax=Nocardioides mangrovi TaxID=2874580 RepID=A0ABS7UHN4_9ACTN|nr:hypothetical protein [Nocardioides mangrovi]MBZ5740315.1 hypothetical protein [Nocardioides mangrovi]